MGGPWARAGDITFCRDAGGRPRSEGVVLRCATVRPTRVRVSVCAWPSRCKDRLHAFLTRAWRHGGRAGGREGAFWRCSGSRTLPGPAHGLALLDGRDGGHGAPQWHQRVRTWMLQVARWPQQQQHARLSPVACRLSPVARRPSPDSRHGSGVPCEGAAHDRDDVRPQHTNPVSQHRLSAARCRCPLPLGHRLWSAALSLGTSDEGRGRGRSAGRLHFQVTAVGAKFIELVPLIKLHHVPALTCRIPTHSEMLAPGLPASTEFHARP